MIALGFTAAILCMAGIFACGMLAGHQLAHRKTEPIDWPAPLPVNAELAAANDAIHARDLIIQMLTTLRLVPASEWTVLPWSAPPSRTEIAASERLAAEVMKLREQLTDALDDLDYHAYWQGRHWYSLKRLRARMKTMVPVEQAEFEADLRTRSLTVAKSASSRAADLSTTITELEIARAEALSLDQFNVEADEIISRHQTGAFQ